LLNNNIHKGIPFLLKVSISPTFYTHLLHAHVTKAQKIQSSHQSFALLGSACVKAARKMLMKSNPIHFFNIKYVAKYYILKKDHTQQGFFCFYNLETFKLLLLLLSSVLLLLSLKWTTVQVSTLKYRWSCRSCFATTFILRHLKPSFFRHLCDNSIKKLRRVKSLRISDTIKNVSNYILTQINLQSIKQKINLQHFIVSVSTGCNDVLSGESQRENVINWHFGHFSSCRILS